KYISGTGRLILSLAAVAMMWIFAGACLLMRLNWDKMRLPNADPSADQFIQTLMLVCGGILALLGALLCWRAFQGWGKGVLVFADGMLRVGQGRGVICRWEDIENVWRQERVVDRKTRSIHRTLRISFSDGQELRLADSIWERAQTVLSWGHFQALQQEVENRQCGARLKEILAALGRGERVVFGEMAVDRGGLTWPAGRISWAEVAEVREDLQQPLLIGPLSWRLASTHGQSWEFTINRIPNVALLWAVIRQVRAEPGLIAASDGE
ncbi:MAG: hypothetical protein K8T25_16205, partial [Planctomycetia bacterium]|nr:hypothetical protein [Planctomycetia bacterium]